MKRALINGLMIFSLVNGLQSCNSNDTIKDDEILLAVFSGEEINDLEEIHDFFTNKICEKTDLAQGEPDECWEKFMNEMKTSGSTGSYTHTVSRKEIDGLFAEFESDVFNEIWKTSSFTDASGKSQMTIGLNIFGKYSRYLEKLGGEEESIKEYYEGLLKAGGISATMSGSVIMQPEKYDITNCSIRLVIAIHWITEYYQPIEEFSEEGVEY